MEKAITFDACIWNRANLFTAPEVVTPQVDHLRRAAEQKGCSLPIYCFMPDHLHVMFLGMNPKANGLSAMNHFKLLSGKWMHRKKLKGWQGDFF